MYPHTRVLVTYANKKLFFGADIYKMKVLQTAFQKQKLSTGFANVSE